VWGLAVLSAASLPAAGGIAPAADGRTPRNAEPPALPGVVRAVEAARRGAPIPDRLVPPIARVKPFPRQYRIPPPCVAHGADAKVTSRVCRVGRASSDRLIVLFGDSHAFMWLPAVLELARRDGWAVVPLVRFGCTPGKWGRDAWPAVCGAWFRWGVRQIRRLRPTVTLLAGSIGERPSDETRAATSGLIAGARRLRALGPLVVVGDPEGPAYDPIPCLVAPGSSLSTCMTTWPAESLEAYDTVARATERLGAGFLPTRGFVCYARQCPAVVGRTIVWMDNSHITGYYSARVAAPFRAAFLRATS
jgi:hypothetical protein